MLTEKPNYDTYYQAVDRDTGKTYYSLVSTMSKAMTEFKLGGITPISIDYITRQNSSGMSLSLIEPTKDWYAIGITKEDEKVYVEGSDCETQAFDFLYDLGYKLKELKVQQPVTKSRSTKSKPDDLVGAK